MNIGDFSRETVRRRWEYFYDLSEKTRAQVTFQQYLSMKNHRWSTDEITFWVNKAMEYMAKKARGREAQRDPTPTGSTQLCYSCKDPWELDHRCKGKNQKHTVETRHSSDDEVCVDGAIDVDSEKLDDDSDSGTKASDSDSTSEDSDDDSCTKASDSDSTSEDSDDDSCTRTSDACTLEEDDDPCVVDRQLDGQDDSPNVSADMSHTLDDLTPQQSSDTSEESRVST